MDSRTKQLLTAMADRHEALSFVDGSFLAELNVSSKECDIFPMVGQILRGFMKLKPSEQTRIQLLGVGMEPAMAQAMFESLRLKEVNQEIKAIKL